jgi:hypothetical protein
MSVGQGSITVHQKAPVIPAPAPPFALNSADNGLSVDPVTFEIVLGQNVGQVGDPAQLLNNREIPFNNFDLTFGIVGQRLARFSESLGQFIQLGDLDNFQPATLGGFLLLDPASGFASLTAGGNAASFFYRLQLDAFGLAQLGDTGSNGNGNNLTIDDANQRWDIGQRVATANLLLNFPAAGIGLSFFDSAGNNPFLLPDPATGGIAFMSAPDFAVQLALSDAANARLAQLGNVGGGNNGNIFTVDDANGLFDITNNALNAIVRINGVNGFTGVVAPVNTITVDGGIVTNVA